MNRLLRDGLPGRRRGPAALLALGAAALLAAGAASPAVGADFGVTGSVFKQTDKPTRKTLKVRSKDVTVGLPTSDPTASGGSLLVELTYGSNTVSEQINLPAAGWTVAGSSVKFSNKIPRVRVS